MIEVKNLAKSYASRPVLKGLSLRLEPGSVTALVGPNACGKTTLIKSILGLVLPDAGELLMDGEPIDGRAGASRYRERIGYMPQNPDYPPNLKVREILAMLEDLRGAPAKRKNELIAHFGIEDALEQPFGQLSGGTRQKVAAVVAFQFDPDVLILDEPTVGMDPVSSLKLKELISRAGRDGRTVLLVSHIMNEVEQLVDRMVFVLDGESLFNGTTTELYALTGESRLEPAIVALMGRERQRAAQAAPLHAARSVHSAAKEAQA